MILKLRNKCKPELDLSGQVPAIFGIVNLTPDSFSDGGKYPDSAAAVQEALRMFEAGAAGVDLGAESTRPGAKEVPAEVEIQRLVPVIRGILERKPDAVISVDTRKAAAARASLEAGADIINDVSGLTFDPEMASTAAEFDAAVVLMHMRGTPETMRSTPELMRYEDVVTEVGDALEALQANAIAAGIRSDAILLDPGLGFAKTPEQDFALVRHAGDLRQRLHTPLFYGPSRKSFLSSLCPGKKASERDPATAGILCALAASGVEVLRVHNVPAAVECLAAFLKAAV
ncbi:MAG: dihydropteroate synthase [Lentisphaeria bacterium]|nr:dihydropteroate synthase [Lentisphaeria bacterium]